MPKVPLLVDADPSLATLAAADPGFGARGRTRLDPSGGGAAVSMAVSVEAGGFRALFLSRVAAPRAAAG